MGKSAFIRHAGMIHSINDKVQSLRILIVVGCGNGKPSFMRSARAQHGIFMVQSDRKFRLQIPMTDHAGHGNLRLNITLLSIPKIENSLSHSNAKATDQHQRSLHPDRHQNHQSPGQETTHRVS